MAIEAKLPFDSPNTADERRILTQSATASQRHFQNALQHVQAGATLGSVASDILPRFLKPTAEPNLWQLLNTHGLPIGQGPEHDVPPRCVILSSPVEPCYAWLTTAEAAELFTPDHPGALFTAADAPWVSAKCLAAYEKKLLAFGG